MKNSKLLGCMLMMIAGSAHLVAAPSQIISLSELNDRVVQDFPQGNMRDLIIECPAGATLPFKITLTGQFITLESAEKSALYLKVLKTCYVRCEGKENFLFSADLQTWKEFSEFFTGELKVSIGIENCTTIASLKFELNER